MEEIIITDPGDEQESIKKVMYTSPVATRQGRPIVEQMELVQRGPEYSRVRKLPGTGSVKVRTKYLSI